MSPSSASRSGSALKIPYHCGFRDIVYACGAAFKGPPGGKPMLKCISIHMFAFIAFLTGQAFAEDCSKALVQATYESFARKSKDYRLSTYLTSDQWDNASKGMSAQGTLYGVPVSGSYSEYHNKGQSMIDSSNEFLSESQAQNIFWTGLNNNSVKAYEACLQSQNSGLYFFVHDATSTQVNILVKYTGLEGSSLSLSWSGGTPEIVDKLPKTIKSGQVIPTVVNRPDTGAYLLSMQVVDGNFPAPSDAIQIAALPSPPPPVPVPPCLKVNGAGQCLLCRISIEGVELAGGHTTSATCDNVIPNSKFSVRYSLPYKIKEATSRRTDITIKVSPNNVSRDDHRVFETPGPTIRTISGTGRDLAANASGQVTAEVTQQACYWVTDVGYAADQRTSCTVKFEKGAYLEFRAD